MTAIPGCFEQIVSHLFTMLMLLTPERVGFIDEIYCPAGNLMQDATASLIEQPDRKNGKRISAEVFINP